MIENDKRFNKRVDMPNKRNNRIFSRILAFLGVIAVCFTLFLPTFNFNNVSASSTSFIQSSDYNISLGGAFSAEPNYDVEFPYSILTPVGDNFISIIKNDNSNYLMELNVSTVDNNNNISLRTVSLDKSVNSQRYKFISTSSYSLAIMGFTFDSGVDSTANTPYYSTIFVKNTEINIPIKYATNVDNLFNNVNCCRYLFYRSSSSETKLNIVYANSMSSFDSDPVISVYLTFFDDFFDDIVSKFLYNTNVVRIDRSPYIDTEIVYENPFSNLTNAISNGVTNFMSIEIFPNFSFGTIISLALGISLFALLLHLIIK